MNQSGRKEGPPIPRVGEEGIGEVGEQPAISEGVQPGEVKSQPPAPAREAAAQAVPPSVEESVPSTTVDTAAPASKLNIETVSKRGLPGGTGEASALIQGLNTGLEAGPEQGRAQE